MSTENFSKRVMHQELGVVTLVELISFIGYHNVGHTAQIQRVKAQQYRENIGPWKEHIPFVNL